MYMKVTLRWPIELKTDILELSLSHISRMKRRIGDRSPTYIGWLMVTKIRYFSTFSIALKI